MRRGAAALTCDAPSYNFNLRLRLGGSSLQLLSLVHSIQVGTLESTQATRSDHVTGRNQHEEDHAHHDGLLNTRAVQHEQGHQGAQHAHQSQTRRQAATQHREGGGIPLVLLVGLVGQQNHDPHNQYA